MNTHKLLPILFWLFPWRSRFARPAPRAVSIGDEQRKRRKSRCKQAVTAGRRQTGSGTGGTPLAAPECGAGAESSSLGPAGRQAPARHGDGVMGTGGVARNGRSGRNRRSGGNGWRAAAGGRDGNRRLPCDLQPGLQLLDANLRGNEVACFNDGQSCSVASQCVSNTCTPFYVDQDGDGYGTGQATGFCGTTPPVGYAAQTGDCCDTATNIAVAKLIHPGAGLPDHQRGRRLQHHLGLQLQRCGGGGHEHRGGPMRKRHDLPDVRDM